MCGSRGFRPQDQCDHDRHCCGTGNNQWNFRIRTQAIKPLKRFCLGCSRIHRAHLVADYGRRYWQSGTRLTPGQQTRKLTLPLFVLSFFLSANKPVFLLLFSAFVLLTYW